MTGQIRCCIYAREPHSMPGRDTEVKINETLLPEQLMLSLKFSHRFEQLIDVGCRYVTVTIVLQDLLVAFIIASDNGTLHHNLCGELRDWVTFHDASTTPSPYPVLFAPVYAISTQNSEALALSLQPHPLYLYHVHNFLYQPLHTIH